MYLRDVRPGRLLDDGSFISEPTRRQLEVLSLAAQGLCNRQIGDKLCISAGTVKVHLQRLYDLWNCRGRTQATLWAAKYGYLDENGSLAYPTTKLVLLEYNDGILGEAIYDSCAALSWRLEHMATS